MLNSLKREHPNKKQKRVGRGQSSGKGIWPAIEEFLNENKETWTLKERFRNNNGFTIIERIK